MAGFILQSFHLMLNSVSHMPALGGGNWWQSSGLHAAGVTAASFQDDSSERMATTTLLSVPERHPPIFQGKGRQVNSQCAKSDSLDRLTELKNKWLN